MPAAFAAADAITTAAITVAARRLLFIMIDLPPQCCRVCACVLPQPLIASELSGGNVNQEFHALEYVF
jgi:hypothetical protein